MKRLLVMTFVLLLCACGNNDTKIDKYAQIVQACNFKVTLCHVPPGNPAAAHNITVGHPAVLRAHLKNHPGDHVGECTCEDLGNCCEGDCCGSSCPPPPRCGDETCDENETCGTCPEDCGQCPPRCGDEECNGEETCATCPQDCGDCPPECGDQVCHIDENCKICEVDCGVCPPPPPFCGDESCDIGEDCVNCVEDCGECPPPPPTCGDEVCNGDETCETCEADCGECVTPTPPVEKADKLAVTGGCNVTKSETGGFGYLALGFLLMAAGAFLFIRRRRFLGIAVLIAGLAVASTGNANAFPTQNLKPAPGTSDYWQTEDAKLSLPSVKLLWHYENDPLALENLTTGDKSTLINHRHTLHLMGAYTLFNRVQVGADVPLVIGQWNGDLTGLGASDAEGGLGNIRLLVKVLVAKWDHIALGVGVDGALPTSTVEYVDDAGFSVTPKAIVSGYIGPVSLAVNAGVRFRDPDSFVPTGIEKVVLEHEFVGSLGASWAVWGNDTVDFTLVSDVFLHVPLKGAKDRTIPIELINGVKVGLPAGLELSVGAGAGLTNGVGAPDFRILGGLTWAYEPSPCVLRPVTKINVVRGPPIVEEVPVPVPVPIINPVYFPFDEYSLTTEAQATLLDDIEAIKWAQDHGLVFEVVLLIGRADRRGTNDYNVKLAQNRADSVQRFMWAQGLRNVTYKVVSDGEENSDQETTDELKLQRDRVVIIKLADIEGE